MSQMKMAFLHQWRVCLLLLSLVHLAFSKNDPTRIIDGEEVHPGEFPFVASILNENFNHGCTATILNDNTILTATHCLIKKNASQMAVFVGHVDLSERHSKPKYVYKVKEFMMHPDFHHDYTVTADVGVLKLERRISFTQLTQQVCLPTAEAEPDLGNCIAIGWGEMANHTYPRRMQKIKMNLRHKCERLLDRKRVLCAVGAKGTGGTCFGDSGGPLMCSVKGKPNVWLQYGISSYLDDGNCRGASYYARVSHYLPWIQKYAQD